MSAPLGAPVLGPLHSPSLISPSVIVLSSICCSSEHVGSDCVQCGRIRQTRERQVELVGESTHCEAFDSVLWIFSPQAGR